MASDWITRLADDERKRDDTRLRGTEAAARKADLVRVHGQRLLDALRATVARDIETFRLEFPGDGAREITLENGQADGGFMVRKPQFPHRDARRVAPPQFGRRRLPIPFHPDQRPAAP